MIKDREQVDRELDKEQHDWERTKTYNRDGERRRIANRSKKLWKGSRKRLEEGSNEGATPRQKRRKYDLLREDW